jgi:hypothetical protein
MGDDIFGPTYKPRAKDENGINIESDAVAFGKRVEGLVSHLRFQPEATVEETGEGRFWQPDVVDGIIPSHRGFITDVIHHYRGHEVSKLFMYWAALLAISAVVKREAWLAHGNGRIFANLYVLIVGDSGSGKNTATDFLSTILDYFEHAVMAATTDPYIPQMKMIDPVTSGATRSGLQEAMLPKNKRGPSKIVIKDANGEAVMKKNGQPAEYFQTSEMTIVQEEMSVFLNRQLFLDDLLPWLLSAYDAKDRMDILTKGGGRAEVRNVFVNLLGNTTPVALKDTLPTGVQSDGFLGRTTIVYHNHTDHMFPNIIIPNQAATFDELKENLGWIAATTFGRYDLSPEANAWYVKWYEEKWNEVRASGMLSGIKNRHKMFIKRIAAILRWQRYDRTDHLIHLEDVQDAAKLIELTMSMATPIYMMILDPKANEKTLKVEETLRYAGVLTRAQLVEATKVGTEDVTYAIRKLHAEGLIRVERRVNGRWDHCDAPGGSILEKYIWNGKNRSKYAAVIESVKVGKKAHQPHTKMEVPVETTNGHKPDAAEVLSSTQADR